MRKDMKIKNAFEDRGSWTKFVCEIRKCLKTARKRIPKERG